MTNSQNGWPVDKTGAHQDRGPIYGNVTVPNGVLEGDVATVLRWVARQFHETVEPLKQGTCWGWFVKNIEGSTSVSNHASGTAVDLNADRHPMGVAATKTFTAKQIVACHAIVKASGGVVRWGGDYSGRPDPMHWEIVGSKPATATMAEKIRNEEDDMPLNADDKKWISNEIAAAVAGILTLKIGDKAYPSRTVGDHFRDDAKLRDYEVGDKAGTKNAAIPASAPIARRTAAADAVLADRPASS